MKMILAGLILSCALGAAGGQEVFRLSPNTIDGLTYDAQSDNPTPGTVFIRIRQALAADYVYAVSFEPGISGRRLEGPDPAYPLGYELLDTAFQPPRVLKSWLEGIYPEDFPRGIFPAGTRNTNIEHPFSIIIPAGAIVPAGTYSGSFSVDLYGALVGSSPAFTSTKTFSISVVVPEYIEIGVVQFGQPFYSPSSYQIVDFGELDEEDTESLHLIVRSNVSYSVSVTSTNGSVLLNNDTAEPTPIPYTLTAAGYLKTMPAGLEVDLLGPKPWTVGGEERYRLDFTIGAFDMVAAGEYTDILTFTVSAN